MGARRVLLVGSGYLACAVARRLVNGGHQVTTSSRTEPLVTNSWVRIDVAEPDLVRQVIVAVRPEVIVLAHGPSDITWCESHVEETYAAHVRGAQEVIRAAGDARIVTVSTDNVFSGNGGMPTEFQPTAPANAYGRCKASGEQVVLAAGGVVVRASLIYGWHVTEANIRENYFAYCHRMLSAGKQLALPCDHFNTPLLIDDLSEVVARLALGSTSGIVHAAGPDAISRVEWARRIASAFYLDVSLVTGVPMAETAYACRPTHAYLASEAWGRFEELGTVVVRGVDEALLALRAIPISERDTVTDLSHSLQRSPIK